MFNRIKLKNILSFGPDGHDLELGPLNVLIGPNGSGKSNLIEAIGLLHATPREMTTPIIDGGGVGDWLWKGETTVSSAQLEVTVHSPFGNPGLRHRFGFEESGQRFRLTDERIENEKAEPDEGQPHVYFELQDGRGWLADLNGIPSRLSDKDLNPQQSILAQRKDPTHYPALTWLGELYLGGIWLYREWSFGRRTPARQPQRADLPNNFLMEDGQNLGMVLNRLMRDTEARKGILKALRDLYEGVTDFHVNVEYGTVQVFLREGNVMVPASRLSDGTMRYLCLLAVLCHPKPPVLICLEEPELGLHPDILPGLADLLREASERCQLIVTTHSDILVDALTDTPESVVVCEKENGQTRMKRLDKGELSHWLEKYRLGELWSSGELGGNRW